MWSEFKWEFFGLRDILLIHTKMRPKYFEKKRSVIKQNGNSKLAYLFLIFILV